MNKKIIIIEIILLIGFIGYCLVSGSLALVNGDILGSNVAFTYGVIGVVICSCFLAYLTEEVNKDE